MSDRIKSENDRTHKEGLKIARIIMVLSSISPLFIIWAIRGNNLIPDSLFIGFCALMVLIPNGFLWLRIYIARKQYDKKSLTVDKVEDHRNHLLVYLFAMLLPFYSSTIDTWRDLSATFVALGFIVFLFWHLNLHYMNIFFAVLGYRVFTVYPPADDNPLTGKNCFVVITKRVKLDPKKPIVVYRISNTIFIEVK